MNGFSAVAPAHKAGGVGLGSGNGSNSVANLLTVRASTGQMLRGAADPANTAAAANSFLVALSAVDAAAFDESGVAAGEPYAGVLLARSDDVDSAADPLNAALATLSDLPVQPAAPTSLPAFDPAMLLAQAARSAPLAASGSATIGAASAAAGTATATAKLALNPANAGSRSTAAHRLGPLEQRSAAASVVSAASAADSAAPARAAVLLSASMGGPSAAAMPIAQPPGGAILLDLPIPPAVPTTFPGAGASVPSAIASGTTPATINALAPDGSATAASAPALRSAVSVASSVTGAAADEAAITFAGDAAELGTMIDPARIVPHAPAASVAPAGPAASSLSPKSAEQPDATRFASPIARPQVTADAGLSSAPGAGEPDRFEPVLIPARQPDPAPASPLGGRTPATIRLAAASAGEPAGRPVPQTGFEPFTRPGDASMQRVDSRTDSVLFGDGVGGTDGRRHDRDGPGATGPVVSPMTAAAPGFASVGPAMPAQPAGLHTALAERIVDQVSWWLSQQSGNADFSIDMPDGRPLSVSVQIRGHEAQVVFRSDQPELRQLIGLAMPQLKESFGQEGLLLSGASVGAYAGASAGGGALGGHGTPTQSAPQQSPAQPLRGVGQTRAEPTATTAPTGIAMRLPSGTAGRSLDLYV